MTRSEASLQANRDLKRRTRLACIASGLCTSCGKNPVGSTRKCAPCAAVELDRLGRLAAARLLTYRCASCGGEPLQTGTRCARCADMHRARNAERWRRIKAERKAVTA